MLIFPRKHKYLHMPSQDPDRVIARRLASKKASRKKDRARVQAGCDLNKLQRKNSIFPKGFFEQGEISNFAEAVGR